MAETRTAVRAEAQASVDAIVDDVIERHKPNAEVQRILRFGLCRMWVLDAFRTPFIHSRATPRPREEESA